MKVSTSVKTRSNNCDRFIEDGTILRLRMSPNQFSELITTLNVGEGVPATLEMFFDQNLPKGEIPRLPVQSKTETFRAELGDITQETVEKIQALNKSIDEITMPKKNKEALKSQITQILNNLQSNLPYILTCANQQLDKAVASAKSVIDSFYTGLCVRLGVKSLREGNVKLIDSGDKE
jgi:hypothetical protein